MGVTGKYKKRQRLGAVVRGSKKDTYGDSGSAIQNDGD